MIVFTAILIIAVTFGPITIRHSVHAATYASDPDLYSNGHKYFSRYDHTAPRDDESWNFMNETYYCSRGCSDDFLERTLRVIEKDMIEEFEEFGYDYKDYYLYKINDYASEIQYDKELEETLEQLVDKRKYRLWKFYHTESHYDDLFAKSYGVPPKMFVNIDHIAIKELHGDDHLAKLENQMKKAFYLFGYDFAEYQDDKNVTQSYDEDFKQVVMKFEELRR